MRCRKPILRCSGRCTVSFALLLLGLSSSATRAGDVGVGTLYDYSIAGVPDFDQKRDFLDFPYRVGLPANDEGTCAGDPMIDCIEDFDCGINLPCNFVGGSMFCAPTAAINWMAYIADHGYPLLAPGPSPNWQSMDEYNRVGEAIALMGVKMSTDPNTGTKGKDIFDGLVDWLSSHPGKFSVVRFARSGSYCPRLADLAQAGLAGQVVILGVGYYDEGSNGNDWERTGGHLMSLVQAKASGNPIVYTMYYNNPSRNDSTIHQSTFISGDTELEPTIATFDGFVRTEDRLKDWTGKATFLDGYSAIVPVFGLSNGPGNKLTTLNPVPVTPFSRASFEEIDSPSGEPILTGALLSSYSEALIVTDGGAVGPNRLWHVDLRTGASEEVVLTDEPKLVATSPATPRQSYVHCGQQIWCLSHPHFDVAAQVTLPAGVVVDGLAYDDLSDEVVVLSTSSGQLLRYPAMLDPGPTVMALPSAIAPTGAVGLVVEHWDTGIWVLDQAGATIYRMVNDGAGGLLVADVVATPLVNNPEAIAVDDAGRLIVSDSNAVVELERSAAGGWQISQNPVFSGLTAGSFLDVVRSRTNFDPATMTGPAWRHVLPSEDFGEPAENPPLALTTYPHGAAKQRYITFAPDSSHTAAAFEVTDVGSGSAYYISTPRTTPASVVGQGLTFVVSDASPVLFDWTSLPVIHVGGCMIAPGDVDAPTGRAYEVRATTDGVAFSAPLTAYTAARPTAANARFWADVVGSFSAGGDGSTTPPTPADSWTPPNRNVSGFDISATLQAVSAAPTAPHFTWCDVNPEPTDRVVIGPDVLRVVNAFSVGSGKEFYPYAYPQTPTTIHAPTPPSPALCPTPPLMAELSP